MAAAGRGLAPNPRRCVAVNRGLNELHTRATEVKKEITDMIRFTYSPDIYVTTKKFWPGVKARPRRVAPPPLCDLVSVRAPTPPHLRHRRRVPSLKYAR